MGYFANFKKSFKFKYCANYLIITVFLVLAVVLRDAGLLSRSAVGLFTRISYSIILAVSLNLIVGFLGELSLGHAGFMCVGAYIGCLCANLLHAYISSNLLVLILAMLIGGVMAGIFGFLIGIPVLRLRGDYLAIVTLAFGEIIKNILNSCYLGVDGSGMHFSLKDAASLKLAADGKVIINGAIGITGLHKASTFTAGILLILVTLFVILNLINSRAGRAIMSIRDNRIAAEATGINVTKYKLMAFITSAVFAGMGGVLYALNFSTLAAKKFDYNTSILVLVFVVLGGIGNIRGSIIAAALLTVLPELLRGMQEYRMLIYALLLIIMMIFNQSPQMIAWRERFVAKFHAMMPERKKAKQKGGV